MKKKILLAAALLVVFTASATAQNPSEVLHYTFNGTCPPEDVSGYGNDGTCNKGVTEGASGQFNDAYSFDGTDDYVSWSDSSSLDTDSEFYTTAWVYWDGGNSGSNSRIFSKNDGTNFEYGWAKDQFLNSDNSIVWRLTDSTGTAHQVDSPNPIPQNEWEFYATGYNGSHMLIYRNTTLVASKNIGSIQIIDTNTKHAIGRKSNQAVDYWSGRVDEPRLWNRTLSKSEIDSLYNNNELSSTPSIDSFSIKPDQPVTGDKLDMIYNVSDSDGQIVNVTLEAFREGNLKKREFFTYSSSNVDDVQRDWYTIPYPDNYTFYVTPEDDSGATSTSSISREVNDQKPSTSLDKPSDANSFSIGSVIDFNGSATEDVDLVNASLYTNETGTWALRNTTDFTGSSDTFSDAPFSRLYSSEATVKWNYRFWDNKTQFDWADSNRTFTVTNSAPNVEEPVASPDPVGAGNTVNITVNVTDPNENLDSLPRINYTYPNGTLFKQDVVMTNSTADVDLFYNSQVIPEKSGSLGSWQANISANDTNGLTNENGSFYSVQDLQGPYWNNFKDNTSKKIKVEPVNVSFESQDKVSGLFETHISVNYTGAFSNRTIDDSLTGNTAQSSLVTKTYDVSDLRKIDLELNGAEGGDSYNSNTVGGDGGQINATLDVSNSNNVTVILGNKGEDASANEQGGTEAGKGATSDGGSGIGLAGGSSGAGGGDSVVKVDAENVLFVDGGGGAAEVGNNLSEGVGGGGGGRGGAGGDIVNPGQCTVSSSGNSASGTGQGGDGGDFECGSGARDGNTGNSEVVKSSIVTIVEQDKNRDFSEKANVRLLSGDRLEQIHSNTTSNKLVDAKLFNSSFRGLVGYRYWTKDSDGNWNKTDTKTFRVNELPSFKNSRVQWRNIGGSENQNIFYNYTDPNTGDIKDVTNPPSGSFTESNTSTKVTGITSTFDWLPRVEDFTPEFGAKREINTTLTTHFAQKFNNTGTQNESWQILNTSATLDIRGEAINYTVTDSLPTQPVLETVLDQDTTSTSSTTGQVDKKWYYRVDYTTEKTFPELQDNSSSDLDNGTQYIFAEKQIENNHTDNLNRFTVSNFTISGTCNSFEANANCNDLTNQNIKSNSKKNFTQNASGDFITNEKQFNFKPQSNEVTFTDTVIEYTGKRQVQIENTQPHKFFNLNISTVSSQPNKCSQANNSVVNIAGSTKKNFSTEFQCKPGKVKWDTTKTLNADSNNNTHYWVNSTSLNISSNETGDVTMTWKVDPEPTDWDNRNGDPKIYCNGQQASTNTSFADPAGTVRISYGKNSGCGSSLSTTTQSIEFFYEVGESSTTTGGNGGGGGGGVDTTESTTISFGKIGEKTEKFTLPFGDNTTKNLTITNTRRQPITVTVSRGSNNFCQYITVQDTLGSKKFGERGTYKLPEATPDPLTDFPRSTRDMKIRFKVPERETLEQIGIENYTCSFTTTASFGLAEDLMIQARTGLQIYETLLEFFESIFGAEKFTVSPSQLSDKGNQTKVVEKGQGTKITTTPGEVALWTTTILFLVALPFGIRRIGD